MKSGTWWDGRRVFITGHTGFMGGWLASFLLNRGAEVHGFALEPPTTPSFFRAVDLGARIASSTIGDIRDRACLGAALRRTAPEVVFHLAARSLVLPAYEEPRETFETNVMGTLNVLEVARDEEGLKALLLVTTDKVYLNRNWHWTYRESDPLGGREPYSASKAASEMVISAYAHSYLRGVGVAALRVGNMIGGGDWAGHRLVPDAIRCFTAGRPLVLRNPAATRPWQHVLDPLPGYLALAEALARHGESFGGPWNFGPTPRDCRPVGTVAEMLASAWGDGARVHSAGSAEVYEETFLSLDSSKAMQRLGWSPRWGLGRAIRRLVDWYRAFEEGEDMIAATSRQIEDFNRSGGVDAG